MDIATRKEYYRRWCHDLETGKIDQDEFIAAVDSLRFQDNFGRTWMIGLQTGRWYYFDGQVWVVDNPDYTNIGSAWEKYPRSFATQNIPDRQSLDRVETEPPKTSPTNVPINSDLALIARSFSKSILAISAVFAIIFAVLVWPVGSAPPQGGPAAAPSPRPPIESSGSGDEGNGGGGSSSNRDRSDGGSGSKIHSAIFGRLVDLSTGRPGAGVEISVNGQIVRTDTDGSYSITGLSAGNYMVAPQPVGVIAAILPPVSVHVDGRNSVTMDLTYRSQPVPAPEPSNVVTPAAPAAEPPEFLPDSGAPARYQPLIIMALGLWLTLFGSILRLHLNER